MTVVDPAVLPWQSTGNPGAYLKAVRQDNESGHFFGLVRVDPFIRTGLHRHLGTASSFVLAGGLTDHYCTIKPTQCGINQPGATHDAIAYEPTLLVSRVDGAVIYPSPDEANGGLHTGSRYTPFDVVRQDRPPEIVIETDRIASIRIQQHVYCQPIYRDAQTDGSLRMAQIVLRPGAQLTKWTSATRTEFWVRGGTLGIRWEAGHVTAPANCFVVLAPNTEVEMESSLGALLIGWADGHTVWSSLNGAPSVDLFTGVAEPAA